MELIRGTSLLAQLTIGRLDPQLTESLSGSHVWHFHLAAFWCEIAKAWQEQWPSLPSSSSGLVRSEKLLQGEGDPGAREEERESLSTRRDVNTM